MKTFKTQVLVAGVGPVGLCASILLSQLGIRSILLEKRTTPTTHPKAHVLNTRTMEIFRELDIETEIRNEAPSLLKIRCITWNTALSGVEFMRFEMLGDMARAIGLMESSPTHGTSYPQHRLEGHLRARAEEEPDADIRFGAELVEFTQNADGVTATVKPSDGGEAYRTEAQYMIGAAGPQMR